MIDSLHIHTHCPLPVQTDAQATDKGRSIDKLAIIIMKISSESIAVKHIVF